MSDRNFEHEVREFCQRFLPRGPHSVRHLASSVRRIVRRVLRLGRTSSTFEQFILAEANKVMRLAKHDADPDLDQLATLVSRRIFKSILRVAGPNETIRPRNSATVTLAQSG